jgi:hypothetical protein
MSALTMCGVPVVGISGGNLVTTQVPALWGWGAIGRRDDDLRAQASSTGSAFPPRADIKWHLPNVC